MESRVVSCEEKKVRQERKWLSGGKMFCNSSEHKDLNTDQTLVLDALLKREKDHPSLSYHLLNSLVEKEKYNYTVHTRFQKKKKSLLTVNLWASLVAQLVKNPPAKRETWVRSLG